MSHPSTDACDDERFSEVEDGAMERLDHTTSIAARSASVILPPEPSKPSPCRTTALTTPPAFPSASPPLDPPMATSIPRPGLANLTLHSPSATIVGTPFALDTDIPRFEYPFPDTSLALPGLYEYNNMSSGGGGRSGVPALSHPSSSASTSCTSSAAPSPSHPPSLTHQHHDPHHHQHQHQHSQHPRQPVHIVSRHATHPIHITHIAHPHANHPISQSPPGSAFPLALTSSLTSASAKLSHSSHPHAHSHQHTHIHAHSNSHSHSHSNTHPSQQSQHHPLSPNASALLADSDREEPPVPPGLLKKKHRWSLGLLSTPQRKPGGLRAGEQRRSATMDRHTTVDHANHKILKIDGDGNGGDGHEGNGAEYFDVSPGSCTSESSASTTSSFAGDALHALHALHISDSDMLQGSDAEPSKLGVEEEGEEEEEERTVKVERTVTVGAIEALGAMGVKANVKALAVPAP
ncbi:hypothetical protein BDN71DRAFT_1502481 [Pleurotus eryngii]|uniref:Uncharacterized protein n=1 Tax=Pleurotus eryngii TaxID=5323 RepID=A0A9P6A867_PLEER|nr:hypothetical protein BDN71DRAFT_1502481 [Pleurotus eryngii]